MYNVLRQALWGLVAVLLQWLLFGRLSLWGAYPDVVLLWVAVVALRFGRRGGATAGFLGGFAMDALYGTWGIQAFVKTLIGFVAGWFQTEGSEAPRLQPLQAFGGALALALVHNGLMAIFLALDEGTRTLSLVTALWIGSAVYTAFVALIGAVLRGR